MDLVLNKSGKWRRSPIEGQKCHVSWGCVVSAAPHQLVQRSSSSFLPRTRSLSLSPAHPLLCAGTFRNYFLVIIFYRSIFANRLLPTATQQPTFNSNHHRSPFIINMRTMFSSVVTRIFRRPFLLASPSRKSRHELVSEAHLAYIQEQRRLRRHGSHRLPSSASCPSLSTLSSLSSMESICTGDSGAEEELSPYESLCRGLRRTEESMGRILNGPYAYF